MIYIPKAPKIRELRQLFLHEKRNGDSIYFFDSDPSETDFPTMNFFKTTRFTGIHVNKTYNRMVTYQNGRTEFLEDKNIPRYVCRDTIGYPRQINTFVDVYGRKLEANYTFGKRGVIHEIKFLNSGTGIETLNFSKYADEPMVSGFICSINGLRAYTMTNQVENWLASHGYKMSDIMNMSPEDYHIMMFECKLLINKR